VRQGAARPPSILGQAPEGRSHSTIGLGS
jgi:hypothetical protein